MNILVLGNGFDLAHGLPTKYTDFLKFVEVVRQLLNAKNKENINIDKDIHPTISSLIKREVFPREQEWAALLEENFWVDYFLQCPMYQKENWIDFESEIGNVIRSIDIDMKNNNVQLDDDASVISNKYLEQFFHKRLPAALLDYGQGIEIITYREIRDILYRDLNKTTRALEIYLSDYVEKISIEKISLEIKGLGVDHVLSFNYSHTYQRFYDKSQKARYDYIHGKAKHDNSIETNNMVLGIDEYLRGKSKNQEIDFIAFKKFYQRIYKATGCEYKNWVDEIVSSRYANEVALREQYPEQIPYLKFNAKHKVFIFGHSLDITDKDVLKDLILNDNVQTTIFYHKSYDKQGKHDNGRKDLGLKIANLVKVIGQDELIRRTGGSTKTIKFKLQTDMK